MIPGRLHCAWLIVQCQTQLLRARCILSAPCKVFAAYSAFWWHRAPCRTASLWVRAPLQQAWLLRGFCLSRSRQNGPGERCSAQAPAKDTETQRELSSTSAQPARKTCGCCFQIPGGQLTLLQKSQGVTRQVLTSVFSGKCFSQIPLSIEAHWSTSLRDIQGYQYQKEGDSNSSAAYDSENIFAFLWAASIPSLFLHSGSASNLYHFTLSSNSLGLFFPSSPTARMRQPCWNIQHIATFLE